MPEGAIEEEGNTVLPDMDTTVGTDLQGWTASPMKWRDDLPTIEWPEIEVGLFATELSRREFTLNVKCKNAAPSEVVKVLAGTATDVPTAIRQEVTDTIGSLVTDQVKQFVETADKSVCFIGPFCVSLRLCLSDGTVCSIPSPRLLLPGSVPLQVGIVSASVIDDMTAVHCVILVQSSRVCIRVRSRGSIAASISKLQILASPPASVWNQEGEIRISGLSVIPKTMAGTLSSEGLLTDVSPDRTVFRTGNLQRGFIFSGTTSPVEAALAVGTSSWYEIGAFNGLPDSLASWTIVEPGTSTSLKSLFTGKGTSLDFSAFKVPVSGRTCEISDRTICIEPRLRLPSPLPFSSLLPKSYNAEGTSVGYPVSEVLIRMADGTVLKVQPEGAVMAYPDSGWLRTWTYPSLGAREVILLYTLSDGSEKAVGFSLVDDATSSSSISTGSMFSIMPERLNELRRQSVLWSTVEIEEPSLLLDWSSGIGPLSGANSRFKIPDGVPVGVARVLPGSMEESLPSLYLFGSGGIIVLKRTSSGGWKTDRLVSAIPCVNPDGMIECGDCVFVLTASGILRLVNNNVLSISLPAVASGGATKLKDLPGAIEIVGGSSDSGTEVNLDKSQLLYDARTRRIALICEGVNCFYDIEKGKWLNVNSSVAGEPWILTYPMDLGVRRIRSLEFFGCEMSGELTIALYASDNSAHWYPVRIARTIRGRFGPICGSPARFRRLLIVGPTPEGALVNF